jgi:hypothetical protein
LGLFVLSLTRQVVIYRFCFGFASSTCDVNQRYGTLQFHLWYKSKVWNSLWFGKSHHRRYYHLTESWKGPHRTSTTWQKGVNSYWHCMCSYAEWALWYIMNNPFWYRCSMLLLTSLWPSRLLVDCTRFCWPGQPHVHFPVQINSCSNKNN